MKNSRIVKLTGIGLLVIGLFGSVFGQQHTENKADQTLRGNGRVNPSTLGMEFDLPLGSYSGRGINVPIGLSYSSKVWRAEYVLSQSRVNNPSDCMPMNMPKYAENSASGWTTSMATPYVEYTGWDNIFFDTGEAASAGCGTPPPDPTTVWFSNAVVRRITVRLPSGETHELRIDDTPAVYPVNGSAPSKNGTYYAVDGSNLRYIEDSANNTFRLLMPDGSFYNLKNSTESYNVSTIRKADKFTDRNGNFTTYNDTNGTWTDTLGRTLNIPFGLTAPAAPTTKTYSMPGMTGTYKFYWKNLKGTSAAESGLADFNQSLKYMSDRATTNPNETQRSNFLFHSEWGSWLYDANAPLFNPIVLAEIELPTGQRYKFGYNIYGIIEKISYPTGGEEKFSYSTIDPLTPTTADDISNQMNFGVTNRKVLKTNGDTMPYEWTYSANYATNPNGYKVSVNNPDGTKSERFLHFGGGAPTKFGYDNSLSGMVFDERSFDSTGALVSKKLTNWVQNSTIVMGTVVNSQPRVIQEDSIIYDSAGNGISTTSKFEYEGDLNQRETPLLTKKSSQYKFVTVGSPLPSTPALESETQYLQSDLNIPQSTKDAYKAQNMVGLATSSVVKDAAGTIVSRSEMSYDDATYSPNIGRGNPTTSRVWDSTKGIVTNPSAYIATHAKFDNYGNLIESTDAKGNVTTTEYSSTYNYAFPTKVTTPIPSDGVSGSNTAFMTTMVYDPTTGLTTSTTDANGLESRIEYDPTTLRPIRTKNYSQNSQVGGTSETVYNDVPNNYWVKSRTQIDATNWAESITYSDGLGRAFKSEKLDSHGSIFTETEFDSVGRPKRSTNPYRANEAKVWTTTNYDSQGRPFEIVTSDGAKVTTAFGLSTSGANIGTVVTVTDQAMKKRRSITNALGQLTRVDEPNDAGQLDVNGIPAQSTNYVYDTLNNLITVNQGIQTRSFAYDSLSRLKQANNPESGIINYLYDNNGNLTKKTDARNVITDYFYDNLNRVTNRNYSAPVNLPNYQSTSNITYTYDDTNITFSKGKLTKVTTAASATNQLAETRYNSFDILGRVLSHSQITDGNTYNSSYVYNLSGALIEETYPSGRVVKNTLDIDGDLAQVQSKKANDTFRNYANAFTYTSAGAVSSLRLGNGKFENTTFNSRLQPIQIGFGSSATSQNLLKLNFDYGGSDNNGNVKSQIITTPTVGSVADFVATQNYTYDSLNRIKQATETVANQPTQGWQQTFVYDRYGNRTFDPANTTTLPKNCGTIPNKFVCATDIPKFNPTANVGDNKLVGTNYDNVGNTTIDANGQVFTYDAENKQTKVVNSQGVTIGEYFYNGDGQRVKKVVPSTNETTIFVYDAAGKTVAEYSTISANQADAKINYTSNDHLGSPRINTDANGQVISRHDYQPYGEEIQRAGNGTDSVRNKFTGYERDDETEQDFAEARYYNYNIGRFNSVDPLMASADINSPQTLNRYTYVMNNPLNLTDPTGMIAGCPEGQVCDENGKVVTISATGAVVAGIVGVVDALPDAPPTTIPGNTPIHETNWLMRQLLKGKNLAVRNAGRIAGFLGKATGVAGFLLNPSSEGCGSDRYSRMVDGECVRSKTEIPIVPFGETMATDSDVDKDANPDQANNEPSGNAKKDKKKAKKKSKKSGKEKGNDIPSWARNYPLPAPGENPISYAERVFRQANKIPDKGADSEFNKLKKFAERRNN